MAKPESAEFDVVALANKCLRAKSDASEELDTREFWDEEEAHDEDLIEATYQRFGRKLKSYQEQLSAIFGKPSRVGEDQHNAIPHNGILEYAIWRVRGKVLYLALTHEDRELPCVVLLGATQRAGGVS